MIENPSFPILLIPSKFQQILNEKPKLIRPIEPQKPQKEIIHSPTPPKKQYGVIEFIKILFLTIVCISITLLLSYSNIKGFYPLVAIFGICSIGLSIATIINIPSIFKNGYNKTQLEYQQELLKYNSELKESPNKYEKSLQKYNSETYPNYNKEKEEYLNGLKLIDNIDFIYNFRINRFKELGNTEYIKTYDNTISKGLSEEYFLDKLMIVEKYFNYEVAVLINKSVGYYIPDYLINIKKLNIYIDIEIDEPYIGQTGKPIHYIDSLDDLRNNFFLNQNFIVIRFAEIQIIKSTNECISFVTDVIKKIIEFDLNISNNLYNGIIIKQWTKDEAYQLAYEKYRNRYLPLFMQEKLKNETEMSDKFE